MTQDLSIYELLKYLKQVIIICMQYVFFCISPMVSRLTILSQATVLQNNLTISITIVPNKSKNYARWSNAIIDATISFDHRPSFDHRFDDLLPVLFVSLS